MQCRDMGRKWDVKWETSTSDSVTSPDTNFSACLNLHFIPNTRQRHNWTCELKNTYYIMCVCWIADTKFPLQRNYPQKRLWLDFSTGFFPTGDFWDFSWKVVLCGSQCMASFLWNSHLALSGAKLAFWFISLLPQRKDFGGEPSCR